jgi:Peptidase family M28
MSNKAVLIVILFLFVFAQIILGGNVARADMQYPNLAERESQIVSLVNGTSAYNYDLELERIALDHNISGYSFRSAGSPGANQTANWIKSQFEALGFTATLEPFEFTNWYLPSQPTLILDLDGNPSTSNDRVSVSSFQPAHYSWPTSQDGATANVVYLPLPPNLSHDSFPNVEIRNVPLNWTDVNITGKIVVVGREIGLNVQYFNKFQDLLNRQPPLAIVYTYWYSWMNFTPPFFGSMSGQSRWGQHLPVGYIDYQDGLWIRSAISANTLATVKIPAIIENGTNYNVVAKLGGATDPEKSIVISGHYDTVMDAGFCDNGAGTAGVLELARVFSEADRNGIYTPAQTLVFIAFTGEELGFVGSINYVEQHKSEMANISAVINLDCIGQGTLEVSETMMDDKGLKIDDVVLKAAEDLGVNTNSTEAGGSDQETFRNPLSAVSYMKTDWKIDPGIDDAVRVKSATMLCSSPLFYSDYWSLGTAGWAHTAYDNSSSTETLGWVSSEVLGSHISVAAVSVMRVLDVLYSPLRFEVSVGTGIGVSVFVAIVLVEHRRVVKFVKKAHEEIDNYMEPREVLFTLVLTVFLIFSSFASSATIGRTEVTVAGIPTITNERRFGFPFEMMTLPLGSPGTETTATLPTLLWAGLLLNVVLFFLISYGVVYLTARLWHTYMARRIMATRSS